MRSKNFLADFALSTQNDASQGCRVSTVIDECIVRTSQVPGSASTKEKMPMDVAPQTVANPLPIRTAVWWCFKFLLIGIFFSFALFVVVDLVVWLAHRASFHQVLPIKVVNRTWMPAVMLVSLPIAAFYVIKGARREPWSALWVGGDPQRFGFVAPQRHGYALAAMAAMVFAAI